jgi:hypothetical protein
MKSPAPIAIALAALFVLVPRIRSTPQGAPQDRQPDASPAAPGAGSKTVQDKGTIRLPLPRGKKLVLSDGTFQLVREYSVEGDRVRYWSVERSAWEQIPAKLVDWDATRRDEAEQAAQAAELKAKIHASDLAERTKGIDVDRSLEIKPGLFLPDEVGFYALDNKLVFEMKQSEANFKLSKGREAERILSGIPLIPNKQTVEIPGAHAAMRLTTAEPEFFMRPADEREPRFRLLRAQVKGGRRVLDNISIRFTGEQTHHETDIDFQTWTPARGVFRYTLNQRLEPGEYAFVEMTNEGINKFVWDFGIDAPRIKPSK